MTRTTYVWDRETSEWVVKGSNVPRETSQGAPGMIVKKYEHVARCLPRYVPGAKRYDALGRAVVGSRQEVLDIRAANDGRFNWDTE